MILKPEFHARTVVSNLPHTPLFTAYVTPQISTDPGRPLVDFVSQEERSRAK
jgi:hypothetical protein